MKYLYLEINIFTVLIPLLFSFHPKLKFYKNFREFIAGSIPVAFLFIFWDSYFTKAGVWGFNSDYISGIYFSNLPIEEILFFFCVPFSCVFTYHCLNLFSDLKMQKKTTDTICILLTLFLLVTGNLFFSRAYTSVTFISLAMLLLIFQFYFKVTWMGKLFKVYLVLLIPFFIVNGILTGTGIEHPVVWYNNSENLSIRLGTVPFEDIFYGFELILLNIYFYEYFISKRKLKSENEF